MKKVALVTGASRGIGKSIVLLLAEDGYQVIGLSRSASIELQHKNIKQVSLDIRSEKEISSILRPLLQTIGRVDVLINNAAVATMGAVEVTDIATFQAAFDTNFFGAIRTIQEVLPFMRKQQSGHIINMSSIQGIIAVPFGSPYCASKAALEALSESLAAELIKWNIRVTIVEPSHTRTGQHVELMTPTNPNFYENEYRILSELIRIRNNSENDITGQSPEEVAKIVSELVRSKGGPIRCQTSQAAKDTIASKLKDFDGTEALNKNFENLIHSGILEKTFVSDLYR